MYIATVYGLSCPSKVVARLDGVSPLVVCSATELATLAPLPCPNVPSHGFTSPQVVVFLVPEVTVKALSAGCSVQAEVTVTAGSAVDHRLLLSLCPPTVTAVPVDEDDGSVSV